MATIDRVHAIKSLHKGSYHKATETVIDWKDGHTTTDAENTAIDAEFTRLQALDAYQAPRKQSYLPFAEQFDQLYHDITAGKLDATGEWYKAIKAVKDANPKS